MVAAYFTAYSTFWARSPDGQIAQAAADLTDAVAADRGQIYFAVAHGWTTHVDPETGLVARHWGSGEFQGCIVYRQEPPHVVEWNRLVRERLARGERCGPIFRDRMRTEDEAQALFERAGSATLSLDATIAGRYVEQTVDGFRVYGSARHDEPPYGTMALGGTWERAPLDGLRASALLTDGDRTLWVRSAGDDGRPRCHLAMDLETGTPLYVYWRSGE